MRLTDFDFDLPRELIAQTPATPRNHARLLVYNRQSGSIEDDYFYNLDRYLLPNTTLVLNNSKVEKSRLRFGATEIFILDTINPYIIRALVKPGRKFKMGNELELALGSSVLKVRVQDVDAEGIRTLRLSLPIDDPALDNYRLTPLPPYIAQNENLAHEYQTVYAEPEGSKAAPTAGLHFTNQQLSDLSLAHPIAKLTLHVGLGTFAPIKANNIVKHKMHSEEYIISAKAAEMLNRASSITAVGTTSLRTLESAGPKFQATNDSTDIFITPGYEFRSVDSLITNFHLPKSTLLMLVAALMGSIPELQRVYAHAIAEKYRFYSFGDAMLII